MSKTAKKRRRKAKTIKKAQFKSIGVYPTTHGKILRITEIMRGDNPRPIAMVEAIEEAVNFYLQTHEK